MIKMEISNMLANLEKVQKDSVITVTDTFYLYIYIYIYIYTKCVTVFAFVYLVNFYWVCNGGFTFHLVNYLSLYELLPNGRT